MPLQDGLRLQILPDITYLPSCQKHHFAAFIQDRAILVVWDDEPTELLTRAADIENQLMAMIWNPPEESEDDEKPELDHNVFVSEFPCSGSEDEVREELKDKPRKIVLIQAVLCALTFIILVAALGTGFRQIAIQTAIDGQKLRFAFAIVVPLQFWLALVRSLFVFLRVID